MLTVASLANQFPSPVEPYVVDEILELRRRGFRVIPGSVRKSAAAAPSGIQPQVVVADASPFVFLRAALLCLKRWRRISDLVWRVVACGHEGPVLRAKALLHTWLGACYAVLLEPHGVDHIYVHHGYFGSWIAMVAARLLDVGFSLTLYGSDLLVHAKYLDVKLKNCDFCLTISDFNRRYILEHYPAVAAEKILVLRLGVDVDEAIRPQAHGSVASPLQLFAIGRLHRVKDHAFLIRACAQLKSLGVEFQCAIAGDGPERSRLESQIRGDGLVERVKLLGYASREEINQRFDSADVVVLTSRSEGIPLVLMEAMARGCVVVAPEITGLPELVTPGHTGFLYKPGCMPDFVHRLLAIRSLRMDPDANATPISTARKLDWIRYAAQIHVRHNFNRNKNLRLFSDLFLARVGPRTESPAHANLVLQQI